MTIELQFPELNQLLTLTNRNKTEFQEVEKCIYSDTNGHTHTYAWTHTYLLAHSLVAEIKKFMHKRLVYYTLKNTESRHFNSYNK